MKLRTSKWFIGQCERCQDVCSIEYGNFLCWRCAAPPAWRAMHAERPYTILNIRKMDLK